MNLLRIAAYVAVLSVAAVYLGQGAYGLWSTREAERKAKIEEADALIRSGLQSACARAFGAGFTTYKAGGEAYPKGLCCPDSALEMCKPLP